MARRVVLQKERWMVVGADSRVWRGKCWYGKQGRQNFAWHAPG